MTPVANLLALDHHEKLVATGVLACGEVLANGSEALFEARKFIHQVADATPESELGFLVFGM